MQRGATLVLALLTLLESCGGRTDPWSTPGLSGTTPTSSGGTGGGGTGVGGTGIGVGAGGATGVGTGAGGSGPGTGGSGTGAGGTGAGTGTGGAGAGGATTGAGGIGGGSGAGGSGTGGTGTGGSATGGSGAGGSGTGGAGTGGSGVGGSGGSGTGGSGGSGGGPSDGGTACFRMITASHSSLDLYLLLDKSAPMAVVDPPDVAPNTRWSRITSAIETFAARPHPSIRMGLDFFPKTFGGTSAPTCEARSYANAATVPILFSTRDPSVIKNALAAQTPGNETWTRPALEGALSYAFYWTVNSHPVDDPASLMPPSVVLMTAALPTGCGGTVDNLAAAAAASYRTSPRIRTHVVGVGAEANGLESVAVAGGTHRAYSSQSLGLDEIFARIARARVICDMPFGGLNPAVISRLEVRTRRSFADPLVAIPKHADAETCGAGEGWFLEPSMDPTTIMLCPATCAGVVDAPSGQAVAGEVFPDMVCGGSSR
jgi:hypothetical protein